MKPFKILIVPLITIFVYSTNAQDIPTDTVSAINYFNKAEEYLKNRTYDSAIVNFDIASKLYEKHKKWDKFLLSKIKQGESYQKLRQFNKSIGTIKPALKKTLKFIDENDTIISNAYHILGLQYYYQSNFDSVLTFWQKKLEILIQLYGKKNIKTANSYSNIGIVYFKKNDYAHALEYNFKGLQIKKDLLGEQDIDVAKNYNNIGLIYKAVNEYDSAILYYKRSLKIKSDILGEKHILTASSYSNIGNLYSDINEYKLASKFLLKALLITKELFGVKHISVADNYVNIGNVYYKKNEYDLSLQYYVKALQIYIELTGEKHTLVATVYNNIGNVYSNKTNYELALKYYIKSLKISKELLGEKHSFAANNFNNIGNVYYNMSKYNLSLDYYFKALRIYEDLFGPKHISVAMNYQNIGNVYKDKNKYDSAIVYHFKGLEITKDIYGDKHTYVSAANNNIAKVYRNNNKYDKALQYYQKGISAGIINFNDTVNVHSVPLIKDYLNFIEVLEAIQGKAEIYAKKGTIGGLRISLRHYQACDTLISQVRKTMKTKSDKITLGTVASDIYKGAVDVCLNLSSFCGPDSVLYYMRSAFYFSEKNKSSVLLESLAGAEAQKFAGIPDTLLKQEHKLQIDIALFKKILAEEPDSLTESRFNDKLFKVNRSYDSLIVVFEKNYPEYYDLKYNQKPVNSDQISELLDKKTALISYFTADSTITIFVLKKKRFHAGFVTKPNDFNEKIEAVRYNISNTSSLADEYKTNTHLSVDDYQRSAFEIYQILFPKEVIDLISDKTENLIIIPDGNLATLPFEALLTQKYTASWTDWKNNDYFANMPYLVKDYNISYSYSANLFYKTFNKSDRQNEIEISHLNDWLAIAPVFDNENISGTALQTRKMLQKHSVNSGDSIKTRAFTRDGMYISELPGSLTETETIFKLFEEKDKKALLKTHLLANEEYIKTDELANYKYLHFATHGIVNESKPELSGLILAQDTTSTEDNILFTGEMYNMKLNADLTVLSACETGLGKITEGEGVIGLTRALLYAGSKNIIVSLWQVSDNSTNDLMVEFYKKMLLNKKAGRSYSEPLRKAKLKLIEEGKYAHPFFWSPFILIGK